MVVGERKWLVDWTRLSSIVPRLFGLVDAPGHHAVPILFYSITTLESITGLAEGLLACKPLSFVSLVTNVHHTIQQYQPSGSLESLPTNEIANGTSASRPHIPRRPLHHPINCMPQTTGARRDNGRYVRSLE